MQRLRLEAVKLLTDNTTARDTASAAEDKTLPSAAPSVIAIATSVHCPPVQGHTHPGSSDSNSGFRSKPGDPLFHHTSHFTVSCWALAEIVIITHGLEPSLAP